MARHWTASASFFDLPVPPFSCSGCLVWIQAYSDPPCPSHFLLSSTFPDTFLFAPSFKARAGETHQRDRESFISPLSRLSHYFPHLDWSAKKMVSINRLQLTFVTQGSTSHVTKQSRKYGCRHSLISGGRTISSNIDDDKSRDWLLSTVVAEAFSGKHFFLI